MRMACLAKRNWMVVMIAVRLSFGYCATLKSTNTLKSDGATEYCSGYTDKHGQWNNGFFCPRFDRSDQVVCCGPEDHRYCCPRQRDIQSEASSEYSVPLLAGLTIAVALTFTLMSVALCYCCPGCVVYRRRKLRLPDRSTESIIDWQMTSATPVRYELNAPPQSRPVDARILHPPPYDDKDAPPNYSSICKIKNPPHCSFSSESAFRPYQSSSSRSSFQIEPSQHCSVGSPRHPSFQQSSQVNLMGAQLRYVSAAGGPSTDRSVLAAAFPNQMQVLDDQNERFIPVANQLFKPLNPDALNSLKQCRTENQSQNDSNLEENDHQISSYELLPLTTNSFSQ